MVDFKYEKLLKKLRHLDFTIKYSICSSFEIRFVTYNRKG